MSKSLFGLAAHPTAGGRNQKLLILGVLIGIVLVGLSAYFMSRNAGVDTPAPAPKEYLAELSSLEGMVLVQNPGRSEWREMKLGARLSEGDRVRTELSGAAEVRYTSGTAVSIPEQTVFTVRKLGENRIEISAPPEAATVPPVLSAADGNPAGAGPRIELQRIVAFGRSLELIGKVESGNSLVVNDETVDVAGDGTFKHFTKPFPQTARRISLAIKVKDLAGRVRVWTATHEFHTEGWEN